MRVALTMRRAGTYRALPRDGWRASLWVKIITVSTRAGLHSSRSVFQPQQLYDSSLCPSNTVATNLIYGESLEVEGLFDNLDK